MKPEEILYRQFVKRGWDSANEYRFHPDRKWRFDVAIPDKKIAVEIEGGVWSRGRHTRGIGFLKDMEKYNSATLLGWKVLRYTPQNYLQAIKDIESLL